MKKLLAASCLTFIALALPAMAADTKLSLGFIGGTQAPEAIALRQFAEEIKDKTGGRIEIDLQGGGALGGDREVIESLQVGTVDMAIPSTSVVVNFAPEFALFDIPFLFSDFDHADKVLHGPIGQEMLNGLPKSGLVGLAFGGMGFRQLTNNAKPIKNADDVKGLKIRTQQNDLHIAVWKELEVLPTPMSITEVYTALQQGVVDGQENPIGAIINNRFGEVQKHLSITDHAFTPLVLLISPNAYEALSEEDKAIFRTAAANAMKRNRDEVEAILKTGVETLQSQGVEIITDVDKETFRAKSSKLFNEFAERFGQDRINAIRDTK